MRKINSEQDVRKTERLKSKPIVSYKDHNFDINNYLIGDQIFEHEIPKCYQKVAKNPFREKWEKAIENELNSLE